MTLNGILRLTLLTAAFGLAACTLGRPPAVPTATLMAVPTQVALIPTTTPGAPTAAPTQPPAAPAATQTLNVPGGVAVTVAPEVVVTITGDDGGTPVAQSTSAPAATRAPAGPVLTAEVGANVRSGPGTNYPIIGGLDAGATASVVGRNAAGSWFVIAFDGGEDGQGWVADQVASYSGEVSDLPVVAAPPAPAIPAAPPPPSGGNPPPPAGGGGLVTSGTGLSGKLTLCSGKTTFAPGERICLVEWIQNNTGAPINYGILGLRATHTQDPGIWKFHTSWDAAGIPNGLLGIDPGCVGPTDRCNGDWRDEGLTLSAPGTYQLNLSVCFSEFSTCTSGGVWEAMSGPLYITIQ